MFLDSSDPDNFNVELFFNMTNNELTSDLYPTMLPKYNKETGMNWLIKNKFSGISQLIAWISN